MSKQPPHPTIQLYKNLMDRYITPSRTKSTVAPRRQPVSAIIQLRTRHQIRPPPQRPIQRQQRAQPTIPSPSNQDLMRDVVIRNSRANDWQSARREWVLERIFEEEGNCECGHRIVDHYQIWNPDTRSRLFIGNVCIKQFSWIGLGSSNTSANTDIDSVDDTDNEVSLSRSVAALKRLRADPKATANTALLSLCRSLTIITESDCEWYIRVAFGIGSRVHHNQSHTRYSSKMAAIKERINRCILLGLDSKAPRCCNNTRQMVPDQTRKGKNTGRYYYKCPLNKSARDRGCGAFKWA